MPMLIDPTMLRCTQNRSTWLAVVALLVATNAVDPARAERADRNKPMVIEADKDGVQDAQRQVLSFQGNVSIAQGTMLIRAERVEVRELPDGYRTATAYGVAGKPASYRQKLDSGDEVVEGTAERIEFDGRADTVRFIGGGQLRRLRGGSVADEISGALLTWDNTRETFAVRGGAVSPTNPSGRVRAVLAPRQDPASAPAGSPGTLQPSRGLPERP